MACLAGLTFKQVWKPFIQDVCDQVFIEFSHVVQK